MPNFDQTLIKIEEAAIAAGDAFLVRFRVRREEGQPVDEAEAWVLDNLTAHDIAECVIRDLPESLDNGNPIEFVEAWAIERMAHARFGFGPPRGSQDMQWTHGEPARDVQRCLATDNVVVACAPPPRTAQATTGPRLGSQLWVAVLERTDGGGIALPAGHCDPRWLSTLRELIRGKSTPDKAEILRSLRELKRPRTPDAVDRDFSDLIYETAQRETLEEIGLRVKVGDDPFNTVIPTGVIHNAERDDRGNTNSGTAVTYYACDELPKLRPQPGEAKRAMWVSLEDILRQIIDPNPRAPKLWADTDLMLPLALIRTIDELRAKVNPAQLSDTERRLFDALNADGFRKDLKAAYTAASKRWDALPIQPDLTFGLN